MLTLSYIFEHGKNKTHQTWNALFAFLFAFGRTWICFVHSAVWVAAELFYARAFLRWWHTSLCWPEIKCFTACLINLLRVRFTFGRNLGGWLITLIWFNFVDILLLIQPVQIQNVDLLRVLRFVTFGTSGSNRLTSPWKRGGLSRSFHNIWDPPNRHAFANHVLCTPFRRLPPVMETLYSI